MKVKQLLCLQRQNEQVAFRAASSYDLYLKYPVEIAADNTIVREVKNELFVAVLSSVDQYGHFKETDEGKRAAMFAASKQTSSISYGLCLWFHVSGTLLLDLKEGRQEAGLCRHMPVLWSLS